MLRGDAGGIPRRLPGREHRVSHPMLSRTARVLTQQRPFLERRSPNRSDLSVRLLWIPGVVCRGSVGHGDTPMKPIPAICTGGQIVPTQPVDWLEGTALTVAPIKEFPVAVSGDEIL